MKIKVKNIYDLTPMQSGMLFHWLINKNSTANIVQTIYTVDGKIDINLFEKSFNYLIERHEVLRTIFSYRNFANPKQVVIDGRSSTINYEDISNYVEKDTYIQKYAQLDILKGFDLSKDLLTRMTIIKMAEQCYKIIWTFHHILMDGWCFGLIVSDFFKIYYSLKENKPLLLKEPEKYVNFINWIGEQEKNEAKLYWDQYLNGYKIKQYLDKEKYSANNPYEMNIMDINVSEKLTSKMNEISKKYNVTLSVIIQCIWGLVIKNYSKTDDIIFGTVVSGRNANIKYIDNIVGLCINTIPVRINIDKYINFVDLLKQVQADALESSKFDYYSLADIQSDFSRGSKLFNTLYIFENYYFDKAVNSEKVLQNVGIKIEDIKIFDHTEYDLSIKVIPGKVLNIKLTFNSNVFDTKLINNIGSQIIEIIKTISSNPEIFISDINSFTQQEKESILSDKVNNSFSNNKLNGSNCNKLKNINDASTNKFEEKLICIWKEVLGIKSVSVYDDFFELGGHSIKILSIISKIYKEFNIEINPKIIFEHRTIKTLSMYLEDFDDSFKKS